MVIAQLRQVRKVSKEDVDTVTAERDDLKGKVEALQIEIGRFDFDVT